MSGEVALTRPIYPIPKRVQWRKEMYEFGPPMTMYVHPDHGLDTDVLSELWSNFMSGGSTLHIQTSDAVVPNGAVISHAAPAEATPSVVDAGYRIDVADGGFHLTASDEIGLVHAFFTALQLVHPRSLDEGEERFATPHCSIEDRADLGFRGIHLCVFPETSLLLLEKAIKTAAFMKFTHVVLEFWGTLQYDVMPELYWKDRFYRKSEIRPLIRLARAMGLQVVPMFNHLGHAAASRVRAGRHVVLNQNPKHALLFEPNGWTWCLSNPDTRALLASIRRELIDLCGPGDYFFIGCDEAYSFATCDRCRQTDAADMLIQYINEVAAEMKGEGRRVIMWGDELLRKGEWPPEFTANGTDIPEALPKLSRDVVVADWQYRVKHHDMPTSEHFMKLGFDTLLCPWDQWPNVTGLVEAAKGMGAFGVLATTWHHLPEYMRVMPSVGTAMWSDEYERVHSSEVGGLFRKLILTDKYEDAGWHRKEVDY